jgi:hypothetical protein
MYVYSVEWYELMNGGWEKMSSEAVVAYFKVLYKNMFGGTGKWCDN